MEVASSVASITIEVLIISAKRVLTKYLLSIKDEDVRPVSDVLKVGDELCRERKVPMSSQLIKKVIHIYKNSYDHTSSSIGGESHGIPISEVIRQLVKKRFYNRDSENFEGDTPLMKALDSGLMDMVWGFIECAKQTNSNLLTSETGDDAVQQFLWLSTGIYGKTAFDVAIANNQLEVASLLLNDAPVECLESQLYSRGKTLLPLLNNDSKYDGIIFDMLEKEKRGELTPPTSHRIQVSPLELLQPERNERREVLRNLDHGLVGSNPNKDTILHLASRLGDLEFVEEILNKDPSMISCRNSNGETPAYVAASEGHADILQIMFRYIKEENEEDSGSNVTRTTDKNSALHIAIQNHHVEVVFFLIEQHLQLANHINDYNESPLYLAAERKYDVVLELMLNKCQELAVAGPNGKTALHVAAISDSPECIKYLLNKQRDLLYEEDEYGWRPLRYAVYHNSSLATAELLNMDNSIGYQLMTEDGINTSAIHIAASRGNYETMEVLMSRCPGLSELIDDKGRNILHVAVENKKKKVIENIFQDESLTSLINQKDSNWNTPIHLLVASDFEIMEKVMDFRVNLNVLNKEEQTPLDKTSSHLERERLIKRIAMGTSIHAKNTVASANTNKYTYEDKESGDEAEGKRKEAEAQFKIAENLVVVVALIATASFAAGITLPGGLQSDDGSKQGTPFLLRKAAFKAFMITNALAFSSSFAVLLIYIALLIYRNRSIEASLAELEYIDDRIVDMYFLTAFALVTMAVAFITGVYVVLTPSLALAICICIMSILTISLGVRVSMANKDKKMK